MLVKTEDLTGAALDWAVFCAAYPGMEPTINVAKGETIERAPFIKPITFPSATYLTYAGAYGYERNWNPSSEWECGGPLIDIYRVGIYCDYTPAETITANVTGSGAVATGDTFLVAACRAIVAAKLGELVEIPDELMQR